MWLLSRRGGNVVAVGELESGKSFFDVTGHKHVNGKA